MPSPPRIAVVIATCNPGQLLTRTLESLAACARPSSMGRILVAENGPTSMAREWVNGFRDRLPIEYHFFPNAKKCGALNRAVAELDDELVIFLDDDIRLHPDTLAAYERAAGNRSRGAFYGGLCCVDYDEEPEAWLMPYLPAAAKGWRPAKEACELKTSGALGFNWAAFAQDIRSVGGYDERCGPGTAANSDEMNMQERLLRSGVKGYYVPEAIVWHYVPRERCSADWTLQYIRKGGVGKGIAHAEASRLTYWKQQIGCRTKRAAYQLALAVANRWMGYRSQFHCRFKIEWLEGKLEGMRLVSQQPTSRMAASPSAT